MREYFLLDVAREGQRVREYHADGAPELISQEIIEFLAEEGTWVTYSPPYTPELNGVAERSNRKIWEAAMAVMMGSVLPALFWMFAVQYATIIRNCIPTHTSLDWMSPTEAKYGQIPDISIFRVFGCVAYVNVYEALCSGFADKGYKVWFVGFTWPLLDRYLVYVPAIDKVVETAHALTDEVAKLERKDDELLVIDPERKTVADFFFLRYMIDIDPDDGIPYVTPRVIIYRGWICACRAPLIEGKLGSEEPR